MTVKVLFFATMRERTGVKDVHLDLPVGIQVADFKILLVEYFPALASAISSAIIAVNREFAFEDQTIPDGAELAVFPPVSGG
jgi:MoaE-MoaD fusion protein